MWTFFMLSLPGSEDHSTSGNRLLPGIVIDDKEGHHYILLYTLLPYVEWIILCKKSPCQSLQSTLMPQVKEELPEHELLVFTGPIDAYFASQVGQTQSNVRKCSPGPTQAWVQKHILGERVHGTTGIKNVISMYQQIIITIIVILMVII